MESDQMTYRFELVTIYFCFCLFTNLSASWRHFEIQYGHRYVFNHIRKIHKPVKNDTFFLGQQMTFVYTPQLYKQTKSADWQSIDAMHGCMRVDASCDQGTNIQALSTALPRPMPVGFACMVSILAGVKSALPCSFQCLELCKASRRGLGARDQVWVPAALMSHDYWVTFVSTGQTGCQESSAI